MDKKRLVRLKKLPERHEDTKVFTKEGTHTTLLCETLCPTKNNGQSLEASR